MVRDALVVGISRYQHLPVLNAPVNDAEAIAHALETNGDFQVVRLPEIVQEGRLRVGQKTPVTLTELEAALVRLFKPSGANVPQTALFYFSGHGLQKEAGIREGYLATSEANPEANFYGLSLFWLRRLLQESPVRQRIILLDCCHSGEILNFLEADPGAHTGTDRLFMAASREYETAYESLTSPYSVFTEALLAGLDARRLPTGVVTNYALTDWVSSALKGESQQPLFENSGSEIVLTRCQNPLTLLPPTPVADVCPYRGLQPFWEEHADYFFGREGLTDQLLDRLRTGNFLAVVGASGSGKSSVVRAGLMHKLQRGQAISGSDRWQIRLITPTEQPFKSLANAFVSPAAAPVERAEQLRRAELFLQDGSAGLSHLIRASLMADHPAAKASRFVLVIDQFEEMFTLCHGTQTEHVRHRFFNCLLAALREVGDRFKLVIVLRADFFSKCSFYKGLAEQIEQHLVMVTPLSYDQIKASILKPANKVGLVCDPNLVYNILLDIVGAPGELPLLQYTLMELWQRRYTPAEGGPPHLTLDAYTALGGVRGTLQKRADEIFYSLELEEQQVAKRIFIALTQLGEGTEDTRRRVLKSELVGGQFPIALVETVVEKLVRAKLIVTNQWVAVESYQGQVDQRFANVSTALRLAQVARNKYPKAGAAAQGAVCRVPGAKGYDFNVVRLTHGLEGKGYPGGSDGGGSQETVDIAHEALIRNWALLRSWLDESREMLRRQRRIERTAREWHSAQQPRSPEFLLHGSRLLDAEDFLSQYPHELSQCAQQYIALSREESRRVRHELRLLQVSIPLTLLMALGVTFTQYKVAADNRVEKEYQAQIATSRQWSAIAQSILQEPDGDPMAALLISRLAAERGQTMEAESSVRSALQKVQLQANLVQGAAGVVDVALDAAQTRIATVDTEGTVRLWSLATAQVERVLAVVDGDRPQPAATPVSGRVLFTPDGNSLVGVGRSARQIVVWSVATGEVQQRLGDFSTPIQAIAVNPQGTLLAASSGDRVQVWQVANGRLQAQFRQAGTIQTLAFTADGQGLLVASPQAVAVWNVVSQKRQQRFGLGARVEGVALSPGGETVAIADGSGRVGIWQVATGRQLQVVSLPAPTAAIEQDAPTQFGLVLQFSPDGQKLGWGDGLGQFGVWQWQGGAAWTGTQRGGANSAAGRLPRIGFSPDGQQFVVSDRRDRPDLPTTQPIHIWDAATGQDEGSLVGHTEPITALHYTADGALLVSAGLDGAVRLWAMQQTSEFPTVRFPGSPIQGSAFVAPLGTLPCATGPTLGVRMMTEKGQLHQWNLVGAAPPSAETVPCVAETEGPGAGGQKLGSWAQLYHGLGQGWHWLTRWLERRPGGRAAGLDGAKGIPAIAASIAPPQATTNFLATVAAEQRLMATTFSADGNQIAIANSQGTITVWQAQANQGFQVVRSWPIEGDSKTPAPPTGAPLAPSQILRQLAFSPDGAQLVGISVDGLLHVWEVRNRDRHQILRGHQALVEQAQFTPDGQRLVSVSWDRTARIWDLQTGQSITAIAHPDALTNLRVSANGAKLLTTSLDGTARIIDIASGTTQVILAGHRGAILDGAFSPTGDRVVTAGADGTARLWNATTGVEQTTLRPGENAPVPPAVRRAFFSPDGQYVATLSENGTLQLWAANWGGLLTLARDRSLRQLTPEECLRYLRLVPGACPAVALNSLDRPAPP